MVWTRFAQESAKRISSNSFTGNYGMLKLTTLRRRRNLGPVFFVPEHFVGQVLVYESASGVGQGTGTSQRLSGGGKREKDMASHHSLKRHSLFTERKCLKKLKDNYFFLQAPGQT